MSQQDKDKAFFVVWLLNCIGDAWNCTAGEAYRALQRARIVDEYILPFYSVLHTMGREALIEDIDILAKKHGVAI